MFGIRVLMYKSKPNLLTLLLLLLSPTANLRLYFLSKVPLMESIRTHHLVWPSNKLHCGRFYHEWFLPLRLKFPSRFMSYYYRALLLRQGHLVWISVASLFCWKSGKSSPDRALCGVEFGVFSCPMPLILENAFYDCLQLSSLKLLCRETIIKFQTWSGFAAIY